MRDYIALLARKIEDIQHDPAESRWIIYELARQTLRKQAYELQLPLAQTRKETAELEEAIASIEAEARQNDERRRLTRLVQLTDEMSTPAGSPMDLDAADLSAGAGREVVIRSPHATSRQEIYEPAHWGEARTLSQVVAAQQDDTAQQTPTRWHALRNLAGRTAQLTLAAFIAVALYVGLLGRPSNSPQLPVSTVKPPASASADADTAALAGAAAAPAAVVEPSPVLPTLYGVYALRDNRLVELEQIPTGPVDPRLRQVLQTTRSSRINFSDGKLAFLVFRRDLLNSAPERVSIRILAKIARMTNFDLGKAVVAPPPTDTWLIRETGYDFRVRPLRESREMIRIHPEDHGFSFPPGRYALMLNGQPYDFAVEGPVTEAAQCVEGFATARGPVFNECRTP